MRTSNDAAVSIVPPKIPYGGFSLGTAPKLACQIEPSLIPLRLSLLPAFPLRELGLPPPFVLSAAAWILRSVSEITCSVEHRHASNLRCSTPGALAPVQVMLSWPIVTYSAPSAPLAGTPQFRRTAVYMRCLRCAGAPRRPASGSGLSLTILS